MTKSKYVPLGFKRDGDALVPDPEGQATLDRIRKRSRPQRRPPRRSDRPVPQRVPATLLWISAETLKWVDIECLQIAVNSGRKLGRAAIARAILEGMCRAGMSFAGCRSEYEVSDVVRALALRPAAEVKG
jgi:hypothetical protein